MKNNDNNKNYRDKNNDDNILQENSSYDNLQIHTMQNDIYINSVYYTSYLNYKKKIFLDIKNNYELIINLFDENICEVLINIYILKKKNKISEKHFGIIKYIFEYIEKLNDIDFIDQENFFIILMNFYKLHILCMWLDAFFEEYMFKELVDYKMLMDKINGIFKILSMNVLIFKIFNELIKLSETNEYTNLTSNNMMINLTTHNKNLIKEKIIFLAQKISFDLFMIYDSNKIYNNIIDCFTYFNEIIKIDNDSDNFFFIKKNHSKIIMENNILLDILKKNKNFFISEYDINKKNYDEIYSNDVELYVKFKINKNQNVSKFIENIKHIDKM